MLPEAFYRVLAGFLEAQGIKGEAGTTAGDFLDSSDGIFVPGVDGVVGTKLLAELEFSVVDIDGDHQAATGSGDLDGR